MDIAKLNHLSEVYEVPEVRAPTGGLFHRFFERMENYAANTFLRGPQLDRDVKALNQCALETIRSQKAAIKAGRTAQEDLVKYVNESRYLLYNLTIQNKRVHDYKEATCLAPNSSIAIKDHEQAMQAVSQHLKELEGQGTTVEESSILDRVLQGVGRLRAKSSPTQEDEEVEVYDLTPSTRQPL